MREEISRRQEFARELVKVSDSSATYGFLEEYGETGIDKIEEVIESDLKSHVKSGGYEETVVFNFLDDVGLLDKFNDNQFRPNANLQDFELFRDQLQEDTRNEYGRHELIAYLQVYGNGLNKVSEKERLPTVDYFDEIDDAPSREPYDKNFGSFTWALHVAGFEPLFCWDNEMMEHQLRKAVHEKNSDRDLLIETLNVKEVGESDIVREQYRDRDYFDSFEDAYNKSDLGLVREMEKDINKWRQITSDYPHQDRIEKNNFRALYPSPEW